jgi:hypothetical protein
MKLRTANNLGELIDRMCEIAPELRELAKGQTEQDSASSQDYSATQVTFKGPKNEPLTAIGMSTGKMSGEAVVMIRKSLARLGWRMEGESEEALSARKKLDAVEDAFLATAKPLGSVAWIIDKDKVRIIPLISKSNEEGKIITRH